MKFRHFNGAYIENIAQYLDEYTNKNKYYDYELFIGTDSKVKKKGVVTYVTVLAIYRKGKGAHLVYKKERRKKVYNMFEKLWFEVEYSVEAANFLKNNSEFSKSNITTIHLDINTDKKHKSNQILEAAQGYCKSFGFESEVKNQAWVATVAADMLCRK